jgi:hypothetical protein
VCIGILIFATIIGSLGEMITSQNQSSRKDESLTEYLCFVLCRTTSSGENGRNKTLHEIPFGESKA